LRTTILSLPTIIGITLLASAVGEARQPEGTPDVIVCLHTSVVATPGEIERAKMIAKSMFSTIGLNIAWREEVSGHESGVSIHVLLTSGSSGDDDSGALAEAFPFAMEHEITVRYDRVHNSAGISRDLEPILLAHVLTHEITHVLQCVDRHSDTGVMKARWTTGDYYDMRWKPLEFTAEDIELIHLGMQVLRSRGEAVATAGSTHER
jgi:hypothetical protein